MSITKFENLKKIKNNKRKKKKAKKTDILKCESNTFFFFIIVWKNELFAWCYIVLMDAIATAFVINVDMNIRTAEPCAFFFAHSIITTKSKRTHTHSLT